MRFFKGHGLGNDYLALEMEGLGFELTPPAVRLLCDRHLGVGSDGVLARVGTRRADFGLRIFNPDGSEAEKSGNGLRIFGAYLHGRNVVKDDWFDVKLVKDTVQMRIEEVLEHGVLMIRVEMGRASFDADTAGFTGAKGEALDCMAIS